MSSGIPTRLVQLIHPDEGRRVALVADNELHLLATYRSLYSFGQAALDTGLKLRDLLSTDLSGIVLNYDEAYALETPWRFLPCFDHPKDLGRCLISAAGPPWRYVASGASLRGHGEPLSGKRSPELAAMYLIAPDGLPRRIGVAVGNRGRVSSIGPELILDAALPRFDGVAKLLSDGRELAENSSSLSSDAPLLLALASVEPDHFEAADFREPGDVHIHFFGERLFGVPAPSLSIPATRAAEKGDRMLVEFEGLGRGLLNPMLADEAATRRVVAVPL